MPEPTVVKTISISGFDLDGEPEIRLMSDGTMLVVFEFMPPSFADEDNDDALFDDFDEQIQEATGMPVIWEDREIFLIQKPAQDTAEKLRAFLEAYREYQQE